ncbi:MAG: hypothetical protein Q8N23_00580 [Archangium sp.]|nr:hypothetical protein [Archangium sp.]MDP3151129.1 hypothetical protein [Archangium sp.]MDP3571813.1 hypothetical protein [Archangium sp.]
MLSPLRFACVVITIFLSSCDWTAAQTRAVEPVPGVVVAAPSAIADPFREERSEDRRPTLPRPRLVLMVALLAGCPAPEGKIDPRTVSGPLLLELEPPL